MKKGDKLGRTFFLLSIFGCPHSLQDSGHFGVKTVAPPFLEQKWQVVFVNNDILKKHEIVYKEIHIAISPKSNQNKSF